MMAKQIAALAGAAAMVVVLCGASYQAGVRARKGEDVAAILVAGGGIPDTGIMVKGDGRVEYGPLPKADSEAGRALMERLTKLPRTSKLAILGSCPKRPPMIAAVP